MVNHRHLSLTDVQNRLLPAATMRKGTSVGFEEGMYGILYQVEPSTTNLPLRGVPIHCVYTTESSKVTPAELSTHVAIFPTRRGVLDLLEYLKLKTLIKQFYTKKNYNDEDPFLPPELVTQLFQNPSFQNIIDKDNCFKETSTVNAKQRAKFNVKEYLKKKRDFHSKVKIRIAMLGGLHRTGTSCFLFSGEEAVPNKEIKVPKKNSNNLLNLTPDMKINVTPPVTILIPKDLSYTDEYIKQCNAYSYHIEEWKHQSITPTYKSLSLLILDSTKHNDIEDNMRYVTDAIFYNKIDSVSDCLICIINLEIFNIIEKFQIHFNFSFFFSFFLGLERS